jgi:hypothetical protein
LVAEAYADVEGKVSVDVKYAAGQAAQYLKSLLGDVVDLRLEEVVPDSHDEGWLITFSFRSGDVLPLLGRVYKQVEVNGMGQPIAMRIRKVE